MTKQDTPTESKDAKKHAMALKPAIHPRRAMRDGKEGVELAFSAFGVRIGVWFSYAALADDVIRLLPPGACDTDPIELDRQYRVEWLAVDKSPIDRAGYHLFANDAFEGWFPRGQTVAEALESAIQHHIAEFAWPHVFIHAGVVGWRGRAIMLPGKSHSGKSTLVAALVEAGATYYSDEYAVLDREGRVHPYPRPLSLREGPLGPTGRIDLSHRAPQGEDTHWAIPVGLVALLRYEAEGAWRTERLSPGEGVLAMCEHTVAIQRRPRDAFEILGRIAASAEMIRGGRGDVHEATAQILDRGLPIKQT